MHLFIQVYIYISSSTFSTFSRVYVVYVVVVDVVYVVYVVYTVYVVYVVYVVYNRAIRTVVRRTHRRQNPPYYLKASNVSSYAPAS